MDFSGGSIENSPLGLINRVLRVVAKAAAGQAHRTGHGVWRELICSIGPAPDPDGVTDAIEVRATPPGSPLRSHRARPMACSNSTLNFLRSSIQVGSHG